MATLDCLESAFSLKIRLVLISGMLLKRGTGSGERGTEVWERVVSGNLHKNPKWPVRIKDPVGSMIEKRRNNTEGRYFTNELYAHEVLEMIRR